MKMSNKTGALSIIFLLWTLFLLNAQEVLVPAGMAPSAPESLKSASADVPRDTLELPFFDDFSRQGDRPHPYFWTDRLVYMNNTYTRDPVTIGVATLDAIDEEGSLNGTSKLAFESDFLTSQPLNLDFPGRDDIWLSFFYEPMGLGDVPEDWDSLTVEFLPVDSTVWETIWSTAGSAEDTFKQVFIPIQEERFLKKGFRFRFKNFASLPRVAGYDDKNNNADHWNIDYVYLDTARSSNITALNDVSMISSLGSLLKSYQAIPWRHFPDAYLTELKATIDISYRNNDTTVRNVTRILKITDLHFLETDSTNGGAVNAFPGVLNTFTFPYNFPFIFYDADSAVFEIKSYLVTEDLDYKWNDTVVRYQKFFNYYAYDDGSAENGYGLRGEGTANASVAYKFKSHKKDTLRAVQMYFNKTLGDATQAYFHLGIWEHDKDLNAPGELIYKMSGVRPEYPDGLNQFQTFILDTLLIMPEAFFYVGWIKTTENILNVGWDVWNNNKHNIFYNLGQEWVNTGFNGSLMIRPLMGKKISWPASRQEFPEIKLQVYPNPATDWINLEMPMADIPWEWSLDIFNLQGKLVYKGEASEQTHYTGDLPEGLYIIRVSQKGIYRASSKLMIIR